MWEPNPPASSPHCPRIALLIPVSLLGLRLRVLLLGGDGGEPAQGVHIGHIAVTAMLRVALLQFI